MVVVILRLDWSPLEEKLYIKGIWKKSYFKLKVIGFFYLIIIYECKIICTILMKIQWLIFWPPASLISFFQRFANLFLLIRKFKKNVKMLIFFFKELSLITYQRLLRCILPFLIKKYSYVFRQIFHIDARCKNNSFFVFKTIIYT